MPEISLTDLKQGISSGQLVVPVFRENAVTKNQTNTTCGIYALCHARALYGLPELRETPNVPPAVKNSPSFLNNIVPHQYDVRWFARDVVKASKVGEIFSCEDMEKLAKALGFGAKIVPTDSTAKMRSAVSENIARKRMIMVPFWVSAENADKCGDPVEASKWTGKEGGAHWCLLFGHSKDLDRVIVYHWAKYRRFSLDALRRSNNDINDWPEQTWYPYRVQRGKTYIDYTEGKGTDPAKDVTLEARKLSKDLAKNVVVIANPRLEFTRQVKKVR